MLLLVHLCLALGLVGVNIAQQTVISFAGSGGATCLTPGGLLGNCVSAGNCFIGGTTGAGCSVAEVCCLRVTASGNFPAADIQTPRTTIQPTTTTGRQLCTYIRPLPPNVSVFARSGRSRRHARRRGHPGQVRRSGHQRYTNHFIRPGTNRGQIWHKRGPRIRPGYLDRLQKPPRNVWRPVFGPSYPDQGPNTDTRPSPPTPSDVGFFITGNRTDEEQGQGTGVISVVPPPPPNPSLDDLLGQLNVGGTGNTPFRPQPPQVPPQTSVEERIQYETYLDFCI